MTCEVQFGRHDACLGRWEGVLRSAAGRGMGVVGFVGVVQLLVVVLAARGGWGGDGGWVARLWGAWAGVDRGEGGRGVRRPLLVAGSSERDEEARTEYGGRVDEEEVVEGEGQGEAGVQSPRGENGYGGIGGGHMRVEPAHHVDPWAGVQRG